ncbi:fluoride efflux transporter CrcB [Opitutaceae bacterium EW11]|nr:fluoride efflux transporter CrcB [Opitutaceae bacterium EW11]
MTLSLYLWIALGGALGSVTRFAFSGLVATHLGETFPWGTFIVNVVGCFVIGFFSTLTSPDGRWLVSPTGRHFFMTGVLGGFTTFSSFSLQTLSLARDGDWGRAAGNAIGSLVVCLVAVWLGYLVANLINAGKAS